jgi:glyceraldehyde-3-phosphate dehydrogenase/erythrose-4-phosphate dehydrogenase
MFLLSVRNDTSPCDDAVHDQRKTRACMKKPVLVTMVTAAAISTLLPVLGSFPEI